jgi:hypothetical protein
MRRNAEVSPQKRDHKKIADFWDEIMRKTKQTVTVTDQI